MYYCFTFCSVVAFLKENMQTESWKKDCMSCHNENSNEHSFNFILHGSDCFVLNAVLPRVSLKQNTVWSHNPPVPFLRLARFGKMHWNTWFQQLAVGSQSLFVCFFFAPSPYLCDVCNYSELFLLQLLKYCVCVFFFLINLWDMTLHSGASSSVPWTCSM